MSEQPVPVQPYEAPAVERRDDVRAPMIGKSKNT
jgi:hypothetical protein